MFSFLVFYVCFFSWYSCRYCYNYCKIKKYKSIKTKLQEVAKVYIPNWSEQIFIFKKLKILCHENMLLMILRVNKLLERFTKDKSKRI